MTRATDAEMGERSMLTYLKGLARPQGRRQVDVDPGSAARAEALGRGLIETADGADRLTPAGRAWLRRALAGPDPFREQHQERSARPADPQFPQGRQHLIDDTESPLAWLRRRKDRSGVPLLTDAQYQAGERLRADFFYAQMTPRVTADWSNLAPSAERRRHAPGGGTELRDGVLAAKDRVARALAAVGPELAGILIDVCCHLTGLEQVEALHGWPQRAGKLVLQLALTRLARHYGLAAPPPAPGGPRPIRHWGAPDYRPSIAHPESKDSEPPVRLTARANSPSNTA